MKVTVQQARESLCIIDFDDEVRFGASPVREKGKIVAYDVSAWFIPTDAEKEAEKAGVTLPRRTYAFGRIHVDRSVPRKPTFTADIVKDFETSSLQTALVRVADEVFSWNEWTTTVAGRRCDLEGIEQHVAGRIDGSPVLNTYARGMHLRLIGSKPDRVAVRYVSGGKAHAATTAVAQRKDGDDFFVAGGMFGPDAATAVPQTRQFATLRPEDDGVMIDRPGRAGDGLVCASVRAALEFLFRDAITDYDAEMNGTATEKEMAERLALRNVEVEAAGVDAALAGEDDPCPIRAEIEMDRREQYDAHRRSEADWS